MGEPKHPVDHEVDRWATDKHLTLGEIRANLKSAFAGIEQERDQLAASLSEARMHAISDSCQYEEQVEEIGKLRERAEAAERERDELRRKLNDSPAP